MGRKGQMIYAPEDHYPGVKRRIFLAGSIEMGKAENWQDTIGNQLAELGYDVLNPRRKDWDESWVQDKNNPKFYEQVTWELNNLEFSDFILIYFHPETLSPVSLLELGLFIEKNMETMIVVCPQGFWRKGNVDIVCARYEVPVVETLKEAVDFIKQNVPRED